MAAAWLAHTLSIHLGFDVTEEVTSHYIQLPQNERNEYLEGLLGEASAKVIPELEQRMRSRSSQQVPYQKSADPKVYIAPSRSMAVPPSQPQPVVDDPSVRVPKNKAVIRNKAKWDNLRPKWDQKGLLMPGREMCGCQAAEHALVRNCISCGRISCKQEGDGPCLYCGAKAGQSAPKSKDDRPSASRRTITPLPQTEEGLSAAVASKDRLLAFQTSGNVAHVIDDQADYYDASVDGVWLSPAERDRAQAAVDAKRAAVEEARKRVVVTLDFAGRRVIQEDPLAADLGPSVPSHLPASVERRLANTTLADSPKYISSGRPRVTEQEKRIMAHVRLQHDDYLAAIDPSRLAAAKQEDLVVVGDQEEAVQIDEVIKTDQGVCLSMHQPWAGLLVAGVKKVEGRGWRIEHKGRLWIAAAAKVPSAGEVTEVQSLLNKLDRPPFPRTYPTGCLLGCVDVVDTVTAEEYLDRTSPDDREPNPSPFLALCVAPRALRVPLRMKGEHKLFKLEHGIAHAARRGLLGVGERAEWM